MDPTEFDAAVSAYLEKARRSDAAMDLVAPEIYTAAWQCAEQAIAFAGLLVLASEYSRAAVLLLNVGPEASGAAPALVRPAFEALAKAAWLLPDDPALLRVYRSNRAATLHTHRGLPGEPSEGEVRFRTFLCEATGCTFAAPGDNVARATCCAPSQRDKCSGKPWAQQDDLHPNHAQRLRELFPVYSEFCKYIHAGKGAAPLRVRRDESEGYRVVPWSNELRGKVLDTCRSIGELVNVLWIAAAARAEAATATISGQALFLGTAFGDGSLYGPHAKPEKTQTAEHSVDPEADLRDSG